ncbi:LCP family protein [Streptomyces sp. CWNU-1]|uniref:LCP family protein n=1 Tax=Streptomyces albipurpureus TaxID=2897419 RepID=A0ABT0UNQ1_9ACTN|nr:LCP family protein [Streptomyces sp. CWNU-1]
MAVEGSEVAHGSGDTPREHPEGSAHLEDSAHPQGKDPQDGDPEDKSAEDTDAEGKDAAGKDAERSGDGPGSPDAGAGEATDSTPDALLTPLAVEPKVAPDTTTVTESQSGVDGSEPPKRKRHWLRWAALGTSLVLLAASGAAWWFYKKLDANITTDTTAAAELRTYEKERPTPLVLDAQNILLLGSDTRAGKGNSEYGRDEAGSQRADTAILLHIAANRQSATAMSIPRDLMVTIPSCRKADGSRSEKQFAQFNWAFMFGGAACSIRTVEQMTGVRIDHHIVVDFRGFKKMVDAVDGVEVCLKEPINDKAARLKLKAGPQTLDGEEALGFVRARKTLGDGSDTERMERQQRFLGALVKKVQSNGVLLNLTKLYPVLDAATKSLTTDPGLDSLRDLYDLAKAVERIPTEKVQFLTVPRQPYSANRNRDELVQPDARELFKQLREDTPITVLPRDSRDESDKTDKVSRKPEGSTSASPTPSPSFTGTNAAEGMCE